ncbi:MAG: tRNA-dihydrouridine synthase family protein [Bacteroidia bacterium]|nr:tRNA-dihydrouridine synthase family protein [Bacteroidia bacterium]
MPKHHTLPLFFAPLQGCTEAIYRNAHATHFGGVESYYTPFVRLEKSCFRSRDVRDVSPENNHVPHLVPQLIASKPEQAETILALFIEKGYQEVDLNLGCPFPLLTKRHYGSGLLPYPEEVASLLQVVNRHPEIRFSVKMRLGFEDPQESFSLLPLLNELPLKHLCLHPRLGKQQYKGEVDMAHFEAFYEACHHPVIYNGDLHTVDQLTDLAQRFPKLGGFMIGRGLLGNPALALAYKEGKALECEELTRRLRALHDEVFENYQNRLEGGDGQLLLKMKNFWEYLLPDAPSKLHKAIRKSSSLPKYEQAVALFWRGFMATESDI